VAADPSFADFAGMPYDQMLAIASERGNIADDPNKDDPLDFPLWQGGKVGEPAWRSPWGAGRPGWHIECSTMASQLLGDQIDIHGGGADLLFPHHAGEVAQAEPLTTRRPWVRLWMHTAMVRKDGAKMSKSLGNLVLVNELLTDVEPDQIRLYLLRHHYRTPWEWDCAKMADTAGWVRTVHAAMARESGAGTLLDPSPYGPRFTAAMDDDLDTPTAVAVVMDLADDVLATPPDASIAAAQDVLRTLAGGVLGLWLRPIQQVPTAARVSVHWPEPELGAPDGTFPL
jgi:L-cysteine:1D-myo-inositol 2-amino-2-deoxy-alpha-D-glucopyranoside ligase